MNLRPKIQQWTAICALNYLYRVKLLYDLAEANAMLKKINEKFKFKVCLQPLMFWKRWKFHRQITSPFALSWDQDSRDQRNTKYVILFTVPVCFLPLNECQFLKRKLLIQTLKIVTVLLLLIKRTRRENNLFYTQKLFQPQNSLREPNSFMLTSTKVRPITEPFLPKLWLFPE